VHYSVMLRGRFAGANITVFYIANNIYIIFLRTKKKLLIKCRKI